MVFAFSLSICCQSEVQMKNPAFIFIFLFIYFLNINLVILIGG